MATNTDSKHALNITKSMLASIPHYIKLIKAELRTGSINRAALHYGAAMWILGEANIYAGMTRTEHHSKLARAIDSAYEDLRYLMGGA